MSSTTKDHAAKHGHNTDADGRAHRASIDSSPQSQVNVGELERIASAVGGAMLVAAGLRRGWLGGSILALAGGALVYRGVSGRCMMYEALGVSTAACPASSLMCRVRDQIDREGRAALDEGDAVAQASFDSFPASDPPSWSGSSH